MRNYRENKDVVWKKGWFTISTPWRSLGLRVPNSWVLVLFPRFHEYSRQQYQRLHEVFTSAVPVPTAPLAPEVAGGKPISTAAVP